MKPASYINSLPLETLEDRIAPATIVVNTNSDGDGPGTLRAAIAQANLLPDHDTIVFDKEAFNLLPKTIFLDPAKGELDITGNLTIKGLTKGGTNLITISGQNASRIFNIDNSTSLIGVAISGLNLIDGKATYKPDGDDSGTDPDDDGFGGAIRSVENLSITNCVIGNSQADIETNDEPADYDSLGGGVYASAILIIKNSIISGNAADKGGGVYAKGVSIDGSTFFQNAAKQGGALMFGSEFGTSVVKNSLFTYNEAVAGTGGAIHIIAAGNFQNVEISNTTIDQNTASTNGGGIHSAAALLKISNSSITNNEAAVDGGGMNLTGGGSTTVNNSHISDNTATGNGGGVNATAFAGLTLSKTKLASNEATGSGAAVYASGDNDGELLNIVSSTISGNTSGDKGGAVAAANVYDLRLTKATIEGNTAVSGAGVHIANTQIEDSPQPPGFVTISGTKFIGNIADTDGGGLSISGAQGVSISSSKFEENEATAGSGGGLLLDSVVVANVLKTHFISNTAGVSGGGASATNMGSISFSSAKFSANSAGENGGGLNLGESDEASIIKSIFSNNFATAGDGGGIFVANGPLLIQKGSISKNHADSGSGGGIRNNGAEPVQLERVKIKGNSADTGAETSGEFVQVG